MTQTNLHLYIAEAQNLEILSYQQRIDPYCLIQIANHTSVYRTKVEFNNKNPKWNESFAIVLPSLHTELQIFVKDKEVCFEKPFYALYFDLNLLYENDYSDRWFNLISIQKSKPGGRIRLGIYFNQPFSTSARNRPQGDIGISMKFFLIQKQIVQKRNKYQVYRNSIRSSRQSPKIITPKTIQKNGIRNII